MLTIIFNNPYNGIRSVKISQNTFTIYTYGYHTKLQDIMSQFYKEDPENAVMRVYPTGKGENKYHIRLGKQEYMTITSMDPDHSKGHDQQSKEELYNTHYHFMRYDRKELGKNDIQWFQEKLLSTILSKEEIEFLKENASNSLEKTITVTFNNNQNEPEIYAYIKERSNDARTIFSLFGKNRNGKIGHTKEEKLKAALYIEEHQKKLSDINLDPYEYDGNESRTVKDPLPKQYKNTIFQGRLFKAVEKTNEFYQDGGYKSQDLIWKLKHNKPLSN